MASVVRDPFSTDFPGDKPWLESLEADGDAQHELAAQGLLWLGEESLDPLEALQGGRPPSRPSEDDPRLAPGRC